MSADIERIDELLGGASSGAPAPRAGRDLSAASDPTVEEVQRRAAVITLVVLSGLALGIFGLVASGGGSGNAGWLVLTITLLAGLVLLYKKFEIGILLFVSVCWIAVGTPSLATGGSGVSKQLLLSQIGLVVLLAVWGTRRFVRREWTLYPTPINLPIVLYLLVCIWSTVNGFMFRDPNVATYSTRQFFQVNVIDVGIRVLSLGALLMIANTLRGRELRWTAMAILLPGILTFTNLLPFLPTAAYTAFPQIIAMALLTAFVVTGWGKLWFRIVGGALAVAILTAYAFKGTEWISGWLGAFLALAVILFVANRRLFWIGCALAALVVLANWGYVYQKVYLDNFQTSSSHRFDMLRGALMYAAHFPLGIGLGNYRSYQAYYGRQDVWGTTTYTSAHGTYAQTLAETGWLGLLTLLLLLIAAGRMLYRYYRTLPDGFARSYALGALGAFVGICAASFAGDYLFPAYHNGGQATFGATVYTFFLIGIVAAMAREQGIVWSALRQRRKVEKQKPAPIYNRGPYANPERG